MIEFENMNYEEVATDLLGYEPVTHDELNIRYECPYCHSYHNKFYLDTNRGLFNCYNCEEKGNIITLAMYCLGCNFRDAIDYLQDWGSGYRDLDTITNDEPESTSVYDKVLVSMAKEEPKRKESLNPVPLPTGFKLLSDNINNPEAMPYFKYLNSRGISMKKIFRFQIGYTIHGATRTEKYINVPYSVVFPTFDDSGRLIYWNTRSIINNLMKTVNAPADKGQYSKRETIFNFNEVQKGSNVVVAESVFNALTITFLPRLVGLATFGKKVTDEQIELLKSKVKLINRFYLFLDTDAKKTQYELATRMVKSGIPSSKIYMVNNPYPNRDINDLGYMESLLLIQKAKPFTDPLTQVMFLV